VLRTVLIRSLPLVSLLLLACGPDRVAIQVTMPDQAGNETPVPGARFLMIPYDRDSILRSLEERAPSPRPSTLELDSLFQAFREPFNAYLAAVDRTATDSSAKAVAAAERARRDLDRVRAAIGPRADSIRARITAWEDTAFRAYDSITARRVRRNRPGVTDSTGADGWAMVEAPGDGYWVTARAVNVRDPNGEWYWNVPVTGDTVRLSSRNGRSRPRFR
jgi:hypothetical protein